MTNNSDFLTTAEAAAELRRSQQTLRRWAMRGDGPLQPIRLRRRGPLLWRLADIERIAAAEPVEFSAVGAVQ